MTFKELIERIEAIAASQPSVKTILADDVYKLNTYQDARYGVFAWTQNTHSGSLMSSEMDFSFNLFYIDRLQEDEGNLVDVYSTAVQVLDNIIRTLEAEGIGIDTWQMQPFTQKFLDQCAGMYATITLSAMIDDTCEDIYGE